MPARTTPAPRAFSLIEVMVAIVIIGTLAVAALNATAAARVGRTRLAERAIGRTLATDLLSEILVTAYEDPEDGAKGLGPDVGEATATRADFDDVDDFAGWKDSTPADAVGAPYDGLDDWSRIVEVIWVDESDLQRDAGAETGIKRIDVTITRAGRVVATATGLRVRAWDELGGQ